MRRFITIFALLLSVGVATAAEADYNYISQFEGGVAVAHHNNGSYYLLNRSLTPLHSEGFDHIADFVEGCWVTSARRGESFGFIDNRGELIGQMDYEMIRLVTDGLFECVRGGKTFLASMNGERIDDQSYDHLQYILSGRYFLAEQQGQWMTLASDGSRLSSGDFDYLLALKDGQLVALCGKNWQRISTSGELLGQIDLTSRVKYNKWGLGVLHGVRKALIVDEQMVIIEDRFEDVLELSDRGLFRFRIASQMGYIDGRAQVKVEAEECVANEYSDGLATTYYTAKELYKVYNIKGREAFDLSDYAEASNFKNNCAIVRPHGSELYGIIDAHGDLICAAIYESITTDAKSHRRYVAVLNGERITIDREGNRKE
ncbi:MAG: hypothetical protein SNH63_02450 [Rikenellaceae bacterium]